MTDNLLNITTQSYPIAERDKAMLHDLLALWEASVRATHHFLKADDIEELKPCVIQALEKIDNLCVACCCDGPVAFMGVADEKIEMLFVSPRHFRQGIGKRLIDIAVEHHRAMWVDVNEQNPEAKAFYERLGFEVFGRTETDGQGNPFPILEMRLKEKFLITDRLMLRPWRESDAEALYRYAKDPAIGPIAGWPPHTSVENSLEIIRTVFSAPEVYAMVLKETGEPIGCCGIMFYDGTHGTEVRPAEAEIGYWVGVPHWGKGYTPEAVKALMKRSFEKLGVATLWIGYYDGNEQSRRVAEKCGFGYHHTEKDQLSPLGDIRTGHLTRISIEEYTSLLFASPCED